MHGLMSYPTVLLLTVHEYQPLELLQQHLAWYEHESVIPCVVFPPDEPSLTEKIAVCEERQAEYLVRDVASLGPDEMLPEHDWLAIIRTEEFLPEDGLCALVQRAADEGANVVQCTFLDRLAAGGRLPPIRGNIWNDFPLKTTLGLSCKLKPTRAFLISASFDGKPRPASDKPVLHAFRWHQGSREAFVKLASRQPASPDASAWLRALHYTELDRIDLRGHFPGSSKRIAVTWFHQELIRHLAPGSRVLEVRDAANGDWCSIAQAAVAMESSVAVTELIQPTPIEDPTKLLSERRQEAEGYDAIILDQTIDPQHSLRQLDYWKVLLKRHGILAGHGANSGNGVHAYLENWATNARFQIRSEVGGGWTARNHSLTASSLVHHRQLQLPVAARCCLNPGLAQDPVTGEWVLAFRTLQRGWTEGRIWVAAIDRDSLELIEKPSMLDLGSDDYWYEDPRLFIFRGELWVSYARLYHAGDRKSRQGVARLRRTPTGWEPADNPIVFESPDGRHWDKNWGFFEYENELCALYTSDPWSIRRFDLDRPDWSEQIKSAMSLWWPYGKIRGGSPPVPGPNGSFWAFYHSSLDTPGPTWRHYYCGLVEIDPVTLLPSRQTRTPLLYETPAIGGWNGIHVIWPGGVIALPHEIILAYGRNDEEIHIRRLPAQEIEGQLASLLVRANRRSP